MDPISWLYITIFKIERKVQSLVKCGKAAHDWEFHPPFCGNPGYYRCRRCHMHGDGHFDK